MNVNIDKIYEYLLKYIDNYESPFVELFSRKERDPFKTLISTILSARTNDKTTAIVSRNLFLKINNLDDLKKIDEKELSELIKPINYYNNKTKFLKKLPYIIEENFNGEIPNTLEELKQLPGVGNKTAGIILYTSFNKPAIFVDTHVHKVLNRIGYVNTKTPQETDKILREKLPKKYWGKLNSMLVILGQNICLTRKPKCEVCPIEKYCNKRFDN